MSPLEQLARIFGGRRQGLVRLRDALSLIQAAIAVLAVTWAQGASWWAVALTVALATWAMVRPLPEETGKLSQYLWTAGIVLALGLSALRAFIGAELLVAGVDFFLLMIVQRLFNRQRCREHMQLLMLGAVLMVIAAVIDADLHYPLLLLAYLPAATLALIVNHLLAEGERLGRRVEFEVDRYASRELPRLVRAAVQVAALAAFAGLSTFLLFPRFGAGVFLRGNLYGQESVGFSESVRLGGFGTIKNDPTVIMHLVPLDGDPKRDRLTWHLRGSAFDKYDKGLWDHSRFASEGQIKTTRGYWVLGEGGEPVGEVIAAPYRFGNSYGRSFEAAPVPGFAAHDDTVRVLVTMEDIGTDLLFSAGRPLAFSLTPRGAIEARNSIAVGVDDQVRVLDRQPGPIQYEFVGRVGRPSRAELLAVGEPEVPAELAAAYLQIDEALSDELRALAEDITAGAKTRVEKVEAVERYLLENYRYSLDQPLSPRVESGELDPVEGFLFDTKAGHCEYFATAMAILLREVGVPTRNVNGFYGAHYNGIGGFYAVRQADAHSWVEVHFGELGWQTFDPTPPAGRTAGDDAPWFPGLAQVFDAVRDAYLEYVIDYDLDDQLAALERLGVERRGRRLKIDWRQLAPWLGGLAGLALILSFARRLLRRRGAREAPEVAIYRKLLRAFEGRALGRREHESATAWARRLAGEDLPAARPLRRFALRYEQLRFGPSPANEAELSELERLAAAALAELRG